MFAHILVPIVDDMVNPKNMKTVATLLAEAGARATLLYISDPRAPYVYTTKVADYKKADERHEQACDAHAKVVLEKAAHLIGGEVKTKMLHEYNTEVYDGILEAAKKVKANAILMASHKRTGLKKVFMGSDTYAVIANSKLPIIVI
jgi:nucleotide-binding universal stress UspA family protein